MKEPKSKTSCLIPVCIIGLVVLFLFLLGLTNFVDSKNSVLPTTLNGQFRVLSTAILDYVDAYGELPSKLEDLAAFGSGPNDYWDPYTPDRSPLGYKKVGSGTEAYCEVYTYRLTAPAFIIEPTSGQYNYDRRDTPEFEELRKRLSAEGKNEALRPGASIGEWVLFIADRIKDVIYYPLEKMTEE